MNSILYFMEWFSLKNDSSKCVIKNNQNLSMTFESINVKKC
jgi:hypothetical protein